MNPVFPMGIATGAAFCDRYQERAELKNNILHNRHTVLLAPRRYGKTSLASEVVRESGLLCAEIDFLLSANAKAVEARILDKVGFVLHQLLPKKKSPKEKILQLFHKLKPELTISALGQKVVLHAPNPTDREITISDVLLNLDHAAQSLKKRVVFFMDEFQQLGELKDNHSIEASIRHAVERSQNVSYIFSGSNRHMLTQMFSDKNRPFYRLCTTINLNRIQKPDHIKFIQKQSKHKWKKELPDETISEIICLSECHPYYVNLICKYFWDNNLFPSKKQIEKMWHEYIESQKSVISYDLVSLSNNQKILLFELAKYPTQQPFSQEYLHRTQLSIASQKEAAKKLLLGDYIYKDDKGITRVLDPAIRSFVDIYC